MSASPTPVVASLPVGTVERAKYAYGRLTQDGATLREIAREFGVSHQAVADWLVKRGYPPVSTLIEYRCEVCKRVYVDSPATRARTCGRPKCKAQWNRLQSLLTQRRKRTLTRKERARVSCASCGRPMRKLRASTVGSPPFCHRPECSAARTRWWYRNVPSYRAKLQARSQSKHAPTPAEEGAQTHSRSPADPSPLTRADYQQLPLPLEG